uniref:Transmembrane and coiled-coil domain-containing protein 7 n=1 Tax=Lygus hesperus TaxID=30085 RepID=A0A146M944_LYGHE
MDIPRILKELEELVSPNQTEQKPLQLVFLEKSRLFGDTNAHILKACEESIKLTSPFVDEAWWAFHTLVLNKLFALKDLLAVADEKESLLSVSQQKTLKAALEIIVVLGIVNHLPQGIGITLKQRSSIGGAVLEPENDKQKCYSLCLTVCCLMSLREDDTLKGFISKQHLGDLLAALFALLFPPEGFDVTDFRAQAKSYLETLIEKEFQPSVVKELLLLHGNPKCPPRVSRAFRGFLTDRLIQRVGVVATIKAILDLTQGLSSPQHWRTVNTLSKLIINAHIKDEEAYKSKVYPQILQLLYANEVEFMQVAVACVRQLFEKDRESCKMWFLDKLTRPLLEPSTEEEVAQSIEGLHNCCGIPCSENWALKLEAVQNVQVNLFRLHCKTNSSIYHLKSKIADLVSKIIEQCDPKKTYNSLMFANGSVKFAFGENGGIKTEAGEEETDWDTAPELFLEGVMSKASVELKVRYFEVALESVTDDEFEKKLVGTKILSELASDDNVQENINKHPEPVIHFITRLLKSEEQDVEITCVGLMVISAMLDDPRYKMCRKWDAFKILVEPLKQFQEKTTNTELKVLAGELRSTILSRGVITSTSKNKEESKEFQPKNNVDEALKEAVDKLLPVRAHGLMSLAKLILRKDKPTYAKRDVLLCIFKENLKEEDSYVYLAAVEGLSALAASYPDDVLVSLTEQYRHLKIPEVRLKVGETLIKVTRLLNEMAVVYKGELIGAYLQGCLDPDHLVRTSSLSNLGELCKILGFRIHMYLVDVFQLVSNILQTDRHPEPRRAAVMVVTLLLQGLGKDTFSTLQELVLELYRALKTVISTDKDDVTKLHAELALQELNSCTLNFLLPSQKMEKRIYVLDPLP